ncbi:MAG: ABC transporter ATP-binding protein, partial [Desulfobulbaceae bacterium]|nr:ABC transporter ATP-binding protein [Desulfobulbaceae bacterium]
MSDSLPPNNVSALQVTDLNKHYKGAAKAAVAGLSFAVGQGEIFGLLGPNGAGKTTAISIMSTLLKPDRGNVQIMGQDINRYATKAKTVLGLVPQDIALYQEMTVLENLNFFGKMHGYSGEELSDRVAEVVDFVSIADHAQKLIVNCSGGIQRRANLAAGIIHQPSLLFLDEPTVGIDAQSRNLILEKLIDRKEAGMALVYTTHYMEE